MNQGESVKSLSAGLTPEELVEAITIPTLVVLSIKKSITKV
jgi:hypothetical protein